MHTSCVIPVVGAIIEKESNGVKHILLQTRWKPGTDYHEKYECPVGRIERGESIYTGLEREVREECGLTLTHINTQLRMVGVDSIGFTPLYCAQQLRLGLPWVMFGFVCRATGDLRPQQSETRDPQRVTLTQLREYLDAGSVFDLEVPFFRYYLSIHDTITFESITTYSHYE